MGTTNSLPDGERYVAVHGSARFKALRRQSQSFTLWASVVFTGWWFLTILLGAYAPSFYRQTVIGNVNVGLLFVLVSFALVLVITLLHLRHARTRLDPLAEQIKADMEGAPR
ncbi:DUF485 domain-containing protein [Nonomuraea sp. NPDC049421]|uniref:DUF485 domain-containing protein n=1 Tax=Nonomuraea sp. NPDC049421 TaxID=3155275 RepID=UPI0034127DED